MNMDTEDKKFTCIHCGIEVEDKRNLCSLCGSLPTCELCEIIFGTPDKNRKIIYNSYNHPSWKNPKRCNICLNAENRIKNRCFVCGDSFPNSPEYFRLHGNCCGECEFNIIQRLKEKGLLILV